MACIRIVPIDIHFIELCCVFKMKGNVNGVAALSEKIFRISAQAFYKTVKDKLRDYLGFLCPDRIKIPQILIPGFPGQDLAGLHSCHVDRLEAHPAGRSRRSVNKAFQQGMVLKEIVAGLRVVCPVYAGKVFPECFPQVHTNIPKNVLRFRGQLTDAVFSPCGRDGRCLCPAAEPFPERQQGIRGAVQSAFRDLKLFGADSGDIADSLRNFSCKCVEVSRSLFCFQLINALAELRHQYS